MGMVPPQISYNTALSSEDEDEVKEEKDAVLIQDIKIEPDVECKPSVDLGLNMMDSEFGFEEEIVVTNE